MEPGTSRSFQGVSGGFRGVSGSFQKFPKISKNFTGPGPGDAKGWRADPGTRVTDAPATTAGGSDYPGVALARAAPPHQA